MIVLRFIFDLLNFFLFLHTVYFGLFGLYGLFRRARGFGEADRQRHFAVLIPARNEETVIGNLVDSIKRSDYPASLIDTYVIVNNCTDGTGQTALEHGADIIDCTAKTKSKADVLRFAFDVLRDRCDIDAYAVFDADNVTDPGFFREMNKALASGAPAAQCRRTGKNLRHTWVSVCYEIYYAMQNAFFNHPRSCAGLTASISGTGWVISKDIIDSKGFDLNTITEDFELTIRCAMDGDRIAYCRNAVCYDEFTEGLRVSLVQRVRWTFGMLQCMQKYEGRLVKGSLHGSWQSLDMALLAVLPVATLGSLLMSVFAYFVISVPMPFIPFLLGLIAVSWAGGSIGAIIALIKSGSGIKGNLKGILAFPAFILTWVPILMMCFFKRDVEWTPIRHTQAVSIDDRRQA